MCFNNSPLKSRFLFALLLFPLLLMAACSTSKMHKESADEVSEMKAESEVTSAEVISESVEPMSAPVASMPEPALSRSKPAEGAMAYDMAEPSVMAEPAPPKGIGGRTTEKLEKRRDYSERGVAPPMGIAAPRGAAALKRAEPARAKPVKRRVPKASGLRAGYADDNKQFNYFVNFLEKYGAKAPHYEVDIQERIVLKVKDNAGKNVPNARVRISSGWKLLAEGHTYSDGTFLFFPSEYDNDIRKFKAEVSFEQSKKKLTIDRQGEREIEIKLDSKRQVPQQIPLDILFVLDTTGSMSEEINRLKNTIEIINLNLTELPSRPKVRFGMVLYKDRGDSYVTKRVPLTASLQEFRKQLAKVKAGGGGDHPEDLQSALHETMKTTAWNEEGIRLSFIITDAPPHIDYGQKYSYLDAMQDARKQGIKVFSVGTGGLNIMGEYILRQISQYTSGRYIFLTYGEKGESEGGKPGSVSHHTGSNFETGKLEAIIIRFAKEEMRNATGREQEAEEEYFTASKIDDEEKGETLKKLFGKAVSQLIDYASISITPDTPVSLFPFKVKGKELASNGEYFGEQLMLSLSANKSFKVLERKDIQAVVDEINFQLSGYVPEDEAVQAGGLAGAKMVMTGTLYAGEKNFELFLKLLRVETGEVLSVTKLVISRQLGLS